MEISRLVLKYSTEGAEQAQRQDEKVRDGVQETGSTAQKEETKTNRWMAANKMALLAIGAAAVAGAAILIKASPSLSASMDSIRTAFSLVAMEAGEALAPALEKVEEGAWLLAESFEAQSEPVQGFMTLGLVGFLIGLEGQYGTLSNAVDWYKTTTEDVVNAGLKNWQDYGDKIAWVTGGVGLLTDEIIDLTFGLDDSNASVEAEIVSLDEFTGSLADTLSKLETWSNITIAATTDAENFAINLQRAADAGFTLSFATSEATTDLDGFGDSLGNVIGFTSDFADELNDLNEAIMPTQASLSEMLFTLGEVGDFISRAAGAVIEFPEVAPQVAEKRKRESLEYLEGLGLRPTPVTPELEEEIALQQRKARLGAPASFSTTLNIQTGAIQITGAGVGTIDEDLLAAKIAEAMEDKFGGRT